MKYFKSILIISVLCFVSLSAFNVVHLKNGFEQIVNPKDSTKIDSLQYLIDDYCYAKSLKYKNEKDINNLESKIKSNDTEMKLWKDMLDSYREKSDTLFDLIELRIDKIKKENSKNAKQIENLTIETAKYKTTLEGKQKKLKAFALKLKGAIVFNFCEIKYNAYIADLDSEAIKMHLFKKGKENFSNLGAVKKFLIDKKIEPRMITNGGMFTTTNEPEGLYFEEGSLTSYELDTNTRKTFGNFFLYPNGVFYVDTNNVAYVKTTSDFAKLKQEGRLKLKLATQSGPMLVVNGKIHHEFKFGSLNEKTRSGVGIISGKKVIFAITLTESNLYEFASFFKDIFGCQNALFLDGTISQMYLKNINKNLGGDFGPMISVSKKQ